MSAKHPKPLTGKKVLAWFVGFFVVIFGVNAIMTYFAVSTFSGIDTDDAYRKGRDYNAVLEEARAQQELDWRVDLTTSSQGDGSFVVTAQLVKKSGAPLQDATVFVRLKRPTHEGMDLTAALIEGAAGTYENAFSLPAAGNWRVIVEATSPEGEPYRIEKQVVVRGV